MKHLQNQEDFSDLEKHLQKFKPAAPPSELTAKLLKIVEEKKHSNPGKRYSHRLFLKLWIPFVYSNVKSVKGNRSFAYYNKGVALRKKALYLPLERKYLAYKYLGEAIEAYQKSIKIIKKNYDAYYNKAIAHHLRGEYRDAGLDYCKAIQLEPMKFEAHYNLAVLLRTLNRYQDSMKELEKAALLIVESPDSTQLQTTYIFNLLNEF